MKAGPSHWRWMAVFLYCHHWKVNSAWYPSYALQQNLEELSEGPGTA